jgi:ABC-2 type transport system permease protein
MSVGAQHTYHLFVRVMRNLARQPIWVVFFVIQPLFWLLLYSQLFERVVELPGFRTNSYIDFIAPGIAIMTAFFSGTWAGMGLIEDLDRGVVERFLATPARRSAIVLSRTLQSAVTAAVQAFIILVVALALGATNGGPLGWVVILVASFLIAGGFAGMSNGIALLTRQEATMIAVANFIGLPLLFFSSVLIASTLIPEWMRTLSLGNPVEWSVRAARELVLIGSTEWGDVALYLLLLAGFAVATASFATWSFRVYQRTL